jgi:tRNA-splicing ligase RtcB
MAHNITGKDLRTLGFPEGRAIGAAMVQLARKENKNVNRQELLGVLQDVLGDPGKYSTDLQWSHTAAALIPAVSRHIDLVARKAYAVYGAEGIEQGAIQQMETAMKLPVTVAGALMPDAHQGYGLPIGGVLATDNAVIPYAVGVDIGCRMALSVFPLEAMQGYQAARLKQVLLENSRFGGRFEKFKRPMDHPVLDRAEFRDVPFLKNKKQTAVDQIGTSGGGNHFVEFGLVEVSDQDVSFPGIAPGLYAGLLTHSGSRGLGASIAKHYTDLAMERCMLPDAAKHLAWLGLDTEVGQEYWAAMNLAGDYASACHDQIHKRIANALGERPLALVENHHNFAWKEQYDGREVITHRKGATPAGKGVLGIIPGSMASACYIVSGKGKPDSLSSASHGAGRLMSRSAAKNVITDSGMRKRLADLGIELIGGGPDEATDAYKPIEQVMAAQTDLVDIIGTFSPRVVRMEGAAEAFDKPWQNKKK